MVSLLAKKNKERERTVSANKKGTIPSKKQHNIVDPITFNGGELFEAHTLLRGILGENAARHVPMVIEEERIVLGGENKGSGMSALVWLPCKNLGKVKRTNIDMDVLSGALKQAEEVHLTFANESEALFRSGQKFSGKITLAPSGNLPEIPTTTSPLNREAMKFFAAQNKKIRLVDALGLDIIPASYLILGPKGLLLFSFDQAHSSFVHTSQIKSPKETVLLAVVNDMLPILDKLMEDDSGKMWFTDTQMVVENDKCRASFAKFAPATEHHLIAHQYFYDHFPRKGGALFSDLKGLDRVISSLSSFSDGHTPATANLTANGLTIEIKSSHFAGKDTVDLQNGVSATWNFIEGCMADSLRLMEINSLTRLVPEKNNNEITHFWLIQEKEGLKFGHVIKTLSS